METPRSVLLRVAGERLNQSHSFITENKNAVKMKKHLSDSKQNHSCNDYFTTYFLIIISIDYLFCQENIRKA